MSLESAAAFFDDAIADEAVRSKLVAAIAGKEPKDKAEAVADLGKSLGFDFTADEALLIRSATRTALIKAGSLDDELDDLDLQAVAGGAGARMDTSLIPAFSQAIGTAVSGLSPKGTGFFFGAGAAQGSAAVMNGGGAKEFVTSFVEGVASAGQQIGDYERKAVDFLSSW